MKRLERFWSAIEDLPGPAAVASVWRRRLGPEFDLVTPLLRPREKPAASLPCPRQHDVLHRVVEHAPGDYVSVCPECCPTEPLSKADLAVYALDRLALLQSVARAFDWSLRMEAGEGLPHTERLAVHAPTAGYRFPVYLSIVMQGEEALAAARAMVAANEGAFLVFTPTRRHWLLACEKLIASRKAALLPLDESIAVDDEGRLAPIRPPEEILADFHRAVLPAPEAESGIAFFPTPDGATWRDLRMHFQDNQTVVVEVMGRRGVYHCSQMGMASKRNGSPTVQWALLMAFAEEDGVLTWKSNHANHKNQKRREILAQALQQFFRIEGDPIETFGNGWRTRFAVTLAG